MKPITFLGDSLKQLRSFGRDALQDVGYQLYLVQCGQRPDDVKPMSSIGPGVEEIRIWNQAGTYRVVYTARFKEAVYVLHAFQKKTQQTARSDIELARRRYREIEVDNER